MYIFYRDANVGGMGKEKNIFYWEPFYRDVGLIMLCSISERGKFDGRCFALTNKITHTQFLHRRQQENSGMLICVLFLFHHQ